MGKTTPLKKSDGSGQLAGSVGRGKTHIPKAAPAAVGAQGAAPSNVGARPNLFAGSEIHQAYAASGVANPREAHDRLSRYLLEEDGSYAIHPPVWSPLTPGTVRALLHGNVDLYLAERDHEFSNEMIDSTHAAADYMESHHPGSADPTRELLRDRARHMPVEDHRPVAQGGYYATHPHPFQQKMNPETLCYEPGDPVAVQDVLELLEREDRTLRSSKDLATGAFLLGPVSLKSGYWNIEVDEMSSDILQSGLDEEATYQALALTFSGGKSTNSGFDAVWEPAANVSPPSMSVIDWLIGVGRDGEWFTFGSWASGHGSVSA